MAEEKKEGGGKDAKELALVVIADTVHDAYKDLVRPLARQVGTFAETIGMAMNAAVRPLRQRIENPKEFGNVIAREVENRLVGVSPENVVPPPPQIMAKTLAGLTESWDDEQLRGMFLNLLARAMNADTSSTVHPMIIEAVRQMSPVDAHLFHEIARCNLRDTIQFHDKRNFIQFYHKDDAYAYFIGHDEHGFMNRSPTAYLIGGESPEFDMETSQQNLLHADLIVAESLDELTGSAVFRENFPDLLQQLVSDKAMPSVNLFRYRLSNWGWRVYGTCAPLNNPDLTDQ